MLLNLTMSATGGSLPRGANLSAFMQDHTGLAMNRADCFVAFPGQEFAVCSMAFVNCSIWEYYTAPLAAMATPKADHDCLSLATVGNLMAGVDLINVSASCKHSLTQ